MSFFNELKRRNVIRVAAGYIVLAWLAVQVVETIFPAFGFGDEVIRFVVIGFAVGFIPIVVLAWVFEWTPDGIRRDEGVPASGTAISAAAKRWDRVVMVVLAIAVAYFVVEKIIVESGDVEPAVVVLPFDNLSSDPEQEYFAIGMSESVHSSLARIPALVVSAWQTTLELRKQGLGATDIADKLEAPNMLEGTVQRAGDRVRVTARLVAVGTDTTLWSETYDRTLDDIFAIQDEIAADVVLNLRIQLIGEVPRSRHVDPEVLRLNRQAWSLLHSEFGPEQSLELAMAADEFLDQALAIDPGNVDALMAKSSVNAELRSSGVISIAEELQRWEEIKAQALASDAEHGLLNAYLITDSFNWYSPLGPRNFEQANVELQRALQNGLNSIEVLRVLSGVARRSGNIEAALIFGERAAEIDPTCADCVWQHSENLYYARRFKDAIAAKKRFQVMSLKSGGFGHHAMSLLLLGDYEAALEVARYQEGVSGRDEVAWITAMAAWSLGDIETYEQDLEYLQQFENRDQFVSVAQVYAWAGETDLAFEWIDKAIDAGDRFYLEMFSPGWDRLRDDPRWTALRERVNWSEEQLSLLDFSPVLQQE
jgi:adenylate cyclase